MAFQTTVGSGTVNFKTLPDGEVEVYVATPLGTVIRKKSAFLGGLLGYAIGILFLISVFSIIILRGFELSVFAFGIATASFILLNKIRSSFKWFSLKPNEGVKFKGGQVAFTDIDTLVTQTDKNTVSLLLNVRGKQVPIVQGSEAEISYIKQFFKENSPVKFS